MDGAHLLFEIIIQLLWIHQFEKGPLRVGVRRYDTCFYAITVGQGHAAGASIDRFDSFDFNAGSNLDPGLRTRGRHGPGDLAHATDHMAAEALLLVFATTQEVKQQSHGGAGIPGTTVLAVQVVGQDQAFDFIRFKVAIEELFQAAGEKGGQIGDLAAIQSPEPASDPDYFQQPCQPGGLRFRRWLQEERLQVASQLFQVLIHAEEGIGVFTAEAGQFCVCLAFIAPPGQDASFGQSDLQPGIGGDHFQAVPGQLHVADDFRPQHAGHVSSR